MQKQSALTWLVPLIAIVSIITAATGLFVSGGGGPFTFTTVHGQIEAMYGQGLYKNDTLLAGAGFRGTDAVTLFVALPLLLAAYFSALQGSRNGYIVLIGALFFFLYNGASMTFSAAFNSMFLAYATLFSVSLFATITALVTFDVQSLAKSIQPGFPHRGIPIFLFIAGVSTFLIWMSEVIPATISGIAPTILGSYTTLYTHDFDSAVITPAAVLVGIFLWQRKPVGYLLSAPFLILCTLIGVVVIGQTISQAMASIVFPIGMYIGMVGSWIVMGAFAIGLTVSYFRHLS
jgi:hypothetical protein